MAKKVYISTTTFGNESDEPLLILKAKGYEIIMNPFNRKLTKDESISLYKDINGLIAGTEILDKDVLSWSSDLEVISRVGVGMDNIDFEVTKSMGINVYRSQTEPALAVSELVVGLILDLLRKISEHDRRLRKGEWKKSMGSLLSEKTLGIIGLGKVGKTLVEITKGFSLKYLAHDLIHDDEFAKMHGVNYVALDDLLKTSDIISIHLSLNSDVINLFTFEKFQMMKKHAIVINTSRGEVINEKDLERAIKDEEIAGAALDVYHDEPYYGTLSKYENVVLTPHIASYGKELRVKMELEAVSNLIEGFGH